jgi:hypothetical protein
LLIRFPIPKQLSQSFPNGPTLLPMLNGKKPLPSAQVNVEDMTQKDIKGDSVSSVEDREIVFWLKKIR